MILSDALKPVRVNIGRRRATGGIKNQAFGNDSNGTTAAISHSGRDARIHWVTIM
jgi:hypothetical protein